jgi:hypothetical protein
MVEFLGIDKNRWDYLQFIMFQNFIIAVFILLFLWEGWDMEVFRFISLGSLLEFVSLLVAMPIYGSFVWKFFERCKGKKISKILFIYIILIVALVIGGTGIHFAANQIHMNVDILQVEFYDEVLSHYMIWIGIIGTSLLIGLSQKSIPLKKDLGNKEIVVISLSGIFQGLVSSLLILESRVGWYGLVSSFVLLGLISVDMNKKNLRKFPIFIFYVATLLSVIVGIVVWVLMNGSFAEPSAIGFGRF